MDQSDFIKFLNGLGEAERIALYINPNRVAALATQLVVEAGSAFTLELQRKPGIIGLLKAEGAYEGYVEPQINDECYPTEATGLTQVRFQIVPGSELKHKDGYVYCVDVEGKFRNMGLRFPNGAEALLPPARNRQLGRGDHPYVAFIRGTPVAFFVHEGGVRRNLHLHASGGFWVSICSFVGVCE